MTRESKNRLNALLALFVLATSAVLMQTARARGWLVLIKKPLPLRKPLEDLDRAAIAPLLLVSSQRLAQEVVDELGTDQYINWVLKEPTGIDSKGRMIDLAVTYYTGVVDQVPHVPEECLQQGAFTLDTDEAIEMELPGVGETISVRRQSFFPPRDLTIKTYVYYTICVNGDFYAKRNPARRRMADWSETHLYYSKVEVSFRGRPDLEVATLDGTARTLFDRAIEELIKSHWPPRGAARKGESAATASVGS